MEQTLFWLSFIVAIVGRVLDIRSSMYFQYYNGSEAGWFLKDEMGYFSLWKNIVLAVIVYALILAFHFYGDFGYIPTILFFGAGIVSAIVAFINTTSNNKKRRKQIEILGKLRDHLNNGSSQETLNEFFGFLAWTTEYDETRKRTNADGTVEYYHVYSYINLFAWIVSTKPTLYDARQECIAKVCEIARKPEKEWFPK